MLYWGIDNSPTLFRFPKRRGPRFLWHNGARIELTQDPADPFRPSSLSLSSNGDPSVVALCTSSLDTAVPSRASAWTTTSECCWSQNFRLFQSITDATIRAFFTSVCQEISAFPEFFFSQFRRRAFSVPCTRKFPVFRNIFFCSQFPGLRCRHATIRFLPVSRWHPMI